MGNVHFSYCSAHSEVVTTLEQGRKGEKKHHSLFQSVAAGIEGMLDPKVVLTLHSSGPDFLRRNSLCWMLWYEDRVWCGVCIPRETRRNTTVGMWVLQMMWRHKQDLQVEREWEIAKKDVVGSWKQAVGSCSLWTSHLSNYPGGCHALWRCHPGLVICSALPVCTK